MPKMIDGETLNAEITLTKQTGTSVVLDTEIKFIPKTIELSLSAQSANPAFDGGALNGKSASATFTNLITSATNNGISVATHGTAARDAVLYNGQVNGWVNKADNAVASEATNAETWNGSTYYVSGVNLSANMAFDVTVPNGSGNTLTFHFAVDANGNTAIS